MHYRYGPAVFDCAAPAHLADLEVLYVVGGLYGNEPALAAVLELFHRERGRKRLVFNGDFHWFDADPAAFDRVQRGVMDHVALRGNVETELADESPIAEAGCGCSYPSWVPDAVVTRSNRILARLRQATTAAQRAELAVLPMWLRADVGALRLGVVHGDAQSLAGWGFAQEHLDDAAHRREVRRWLEAARVDAFACTHTCLPVFQQLGRDPGAPWVFNNGAAGMPNFRADPAGLLTRIALTPFEGTGSRGSLVHRGVHVDAVAVDYDAAAFWQQFAHTWPPGSDAEASYADRIRRGPDYLPSRLLRAAIDSPEGAAT